MLNKRKNNLYQGFTLIEVVVALILIAVGFLAIFAVHQQSLKSIYETTVNEAVARQFSNYYEQMLRTGYEQARRNLLGDVTVSFRLDGTQIEEDALDTNVKNQAVAFTRRTIVSTENTTKSALTVEVIYTWGGLFSPNKTTNYSFVLLKSGI